LVAVSEKSARSVVEIPQRVPGANDRFAFIQILRGLAALIVVWSHLSGFWLEEHHTTSVPQQLWQEWIIVPFHIFQNGGLLGVVVFFLVSGYIITHTSLRESRRSFAIKRFLRIAPPLILATLVSWLLLFLATATNTKLIGVNGGSVWHWLSAFVLLDGFTPAGRATNVTWTLVIEVIFYLITFVLLGISRSSPLRSVWLMTTIWMVASIVSLNVPFVNDSANSGSALAVGFLLIGRIIYLWQRGLINPRDALFNLAAVVLIYILIAQASSPGFLVTPAGYEPFISYLLGIMIFLAFLRLAPKQAVQPFKMLGDVSYSLYLLHIPVGITLLNLMNLIGISKTVSVIVAVVASVAAAYAAFRLVEVPSQRLARRLTSNSPQVAAVSPPRK
jgi:peptidoglycan/LPS O-acetylase OafA/YrhL